MTMKLEINALRLADTVQLFDGPFGTGTVQQIKDGVVTILRPYVMSQDFSHTGGVTCGLGYEEVRYSVLSSAVLPVLGRKELR